MDKRNFIKSLLASGILGSSPLAALAASELFTPGAVQPVMIIGQSGLPHADELVARLGRVFAAAGIDCLRVTASGSELADYSRVTALLDGGLGHRVIGVMDDAAALIFQELAASRGAACALSTHHRFAGQEVRHCCTSAGLDGSIVWSDSLPAHAERIGRLYAGTIVGQASAGSFRAQLENEDPARTAGTPGSLVSFLLTI